MSSAIAAWLLTYALHSTVAFAIAAIASAVVASHPIRATIWKAAIAGPIATAMIAFAWGSSLSVERPAQASPVATSSAAPRAVGTLPIEFEGDAATRITRGRVEWTSVVTIVWIAGAMLFLLRLAFQAREVRRAAGSERAASLAPLLAELAARAGVRRPLTVLWSDGVSIPLAIGRSTIVVPRRTSDLSPAEQRVLLGHELAHLTRHDPQWLFLIAVVEAIFFFQPLNRIARRRLTEASEFGADEMAVQWTSDGISLARCLVSVASWNGGAPIAHVAAMASSQSQLATRVERLLQSRGVHNSRFGFAAIPLLLATTAAMPAVRFAAPAVAVAPAPRRAIEAPVTPVVAASALAPTAMAERAERAEDPALAIFRTAALRQQDNPDPTFNPAARSAWVLRIGRGRELVPALIEKLGDDDWVEREHATWALAVVPDARAVDALVDALDDEAWRVRGGAASTLGAIGDARAAPALLPLLTDEHWQVRAGAVSSLGDLASDRETANRLRPLIDDPHIAVRGAAGSAVAAIEQRLAGQQ